MRLTTKLKQESIEWLPLLFKSHLHDAKTFQNTAPTSSPASIPTTLPLILYSKYSKDSVLWTYHAIKYHKVFIYMVFSSKEFISDSF